MQVQELGIHVLCMNPDELLVLGKKAFEVYVVVVVRLVCMLKLFVNDIVVSMTQMLACILDLVFPFLLMLLCSKFCKPLSMQFLKQVSNFIPL